MYARKKTGSVGQNTPGEKLAVNYNPAIDLSI